MKKPAQALGAAYTHVHGGNLYANIKMFEKMLTVTDEEDVVYLVKSGVKVNDFDEFVERANYRKSERIF